MILVAALLLERGRIDRLLRPDSVVGVGRHRLAAAAQLLLRLGALLLFPLEDLDTANQLDRLRLDAEIFVDDRTLGRDRAGGVHELALVPRVDRVGRDAAHCACPFRETPRRPNRPPFVPEQQGKGDGEEDQSDEDALRRLREAREPGLVRRYGHRVSHGAAPLAGSAGSDNRGEAERTRDAIGSAVGGQSAAPAASGVPGAVVG